MTRLLQDLIADQASRRSDATAVVEGAESLGYGALEEASSRLAHVLAHRGVRRGSRVCLLLPKTPASIVAIFGVLKAGASYVPLDPDSPAARTEKMLRSADDRFVLTSSECADRASELLEHPPSTGSWTVGWLEEGPPPSGVSGTAFSLDEVNDAPARAPNLRTSQDDLAYIMFTSGSTGEPKGVMITHANVLAFLDWAVPYFGIGPDDRCSSHPPLHFDLSVFDIFGSSAAGAELHLVPKKLNLLAGALARFIGESALTQWFSVPSVLNYMVRSDCVSQGDFPSLKRLIWCGEVLPTPTLMHLMQRLPHATFTNLYGPTEATIASSYYTVPDVPADERADIPIGTPCAGEELLVLDESLAPVPAGEIGELHIAGAGLSPGYWRDAGKTGEAFLEARVDGSVERIYRTGDLATIDDDGFFRFVGRADTQIKSRGYRIELGEIESALRALDSLEDVAVVAIRSGGFESWTICCACVPSVPGMLDPTAVVRDLREALPSYMLPQRWLEYERLPTNVNGKIDRPRLKEDFEAEGQMAR